MYIHRDDDNDKSDDDDDDDEEDGGRISFTVTTAAREREKVREAFLSANAQRKYWPVLFAPTGDLTIEANLGILAIC